MDAIDDEAWKIVRQAEEVQRSEYCRGLDLWEEADSTQAIVEDCPWCITGKYFFDTLSGWVCDQCGYFPGAELYGEQFS